MIVPFGTQKNGVFLKASLTHSGHFLKFEIVETLKEPTQVLRLFLEPRE